MKIELKENEVVLRPETDWERDALKRLRQRGVEKIEFEDDWDGTGGLRLQQPVHPWGS